MSSTTTVARRRRGDFTMAVVTARTCRRRSFAGAETPGTTVTWTRVRTRWVRRGSRVQRVGLDRCTGTIANGETKTCTITNDDQPVTLHVIKHVVNDNGGDATAGPFHDERGRYERRTEPTVRGCGVAGTAVTLDAQRGVLGDRDGSVGLQRVGLDGLLGGRARPGSRCHVHDHEQRSAGDVARDQARDQQQRWRRDCGSDSR